MRAKPLIVCLAIGLLALGQPAGAATKRPNAVAHNTSLESRYHQPRQTHRPIPLFEKPISGVIPRAFRGGNPFQMLNPFAPPKYGTAEESVSLDPDVAGKGNGINLFSISF